jgi:rRNA maturation endonuclease Nob1
MGFFKRAGRQVEQFKRTATETANEAADYQCDACDAYFHTHHDPCPECGGEATVSTESDDDSSESADGSE